MVHSAPVKPPLTEPGRLKGFYQEKIYSEEQLPNSSHADEEAKNEGHGRISR